MACTVWYGMWLQREGAKRVGVEVGREWCMVRRQPMACVVCMCPQQSCHSEHMCHHVATPCRPAPPCSLLLAPCSVPHVLKSAHCCPPRLVVCVAAWCVRGRACVCARIYAFIHQCANSRCPKKNVAARVA